MTTILLSALVLSWFSFILIAMFHKNSEATAKVRK